jgi:hypothetical protein
MATQAQRKAEDELLHLWPACPVVTRKPRPVRPMKQAEAMDDRIMQVLAWRYELPEVVSR